MKQGRRRLEWLRHRGNPYLLIHITRWRNPTYGVPYNLRDIAGGTDNSVQPVPPWRIGARATIQAPSWPMLPRAPATGVSALRAKTPTWIAGQPGAGRHRRQGHLKAADWCLPIRGVPSSDPAATGALSIPYLRFILTVRWVLYAELGEPGKFCQCSPALRPNLAFDTTYRSWGAP